MNAVDVISGGIPSGSERGSGLEHTFNIFPNALLRLAVHVQQVMCARTVGRKAGRLFRLILLHDRTSGRIDMWIPFPVEMAGGPYGSGSEKGTVRVPEKTNTKKFSS